MDVDLQRVVALTQVLVGVGPAVSNPLAGDAVGAAPWVFVAAVGVVSFRLFPDSGPARV